MKNFLVQLINNTEFKNIDLIQSDITILFKQLDSIKKEYLYKSDFHGLYHSEKVLLFTYLIGKTIRLNNEEMQIVLDAAMYHDIGREGENEDDYHGYSSSLILKKNKNQILTNEIYQDKNNLDYLLAICDNHSRKDVFDKNTFENYKYENEELNYGEFKKLSDVLKDADALDRTRFPFIWAESLKENYLRYDCSKNLIEFARFVNNLYCQREVKKLYDEYSIEYGKRPNSINEEACFHGIGADFFKLESIVKNGILSSYSRKIQELDFSNNFFGSNGELWISVVDATMVSKNGDAFKKYIQSGISFYCFVPKMKTDDGSDFNFADTRSKSEYLDEKYVFDKIEPEQIHSIIIPNRMINESVENLNYMICATNIVTIEETLKYYKKEMVKRGYFELFDESRINQLLDVFKKEQLEYDKGYNNNDKIRRDEYYVFLDEIKSLINLEVQKWFKKFYCFMLNKPDDENTIITVKDVITSLSIKLKFNTIINSPTDETIIMLNKLNYEKESNKIK